MKKEDVSIHEEKKIIDHGRTDAILWKRHSYPLMNLSLRWTKIDGIYIPVREEYGNNFNMTRTDCLEWLDKNFPDIKVPRSACICCPYRSDYEWLKIKEETPDIFEEACSFDEKIRDRHDDLEGKPFIHSSLVPLRIVKFTDDKTNQTSQICEGMCGN